MPPIQVSPVSAESDEDARNARFQHQHFFMQAAFSGIGMVFSAIMLFIGKEPSIYLPIFTSILFSWLPSPLSNTTGASALKRLSEMASASVPFMVASQRRDTGNNNANNNANTTSLDVETPRRPHHTCTNTQHYSTHTNPAFDTNGDFDTTFGSTASTPTPR